MRILYSVGIRLLQFVLWILSAFNKKISLGVKGRARTFKDLETGINKNAKRIWFHCASLGEYEQGLPVFESIRQKYPDHQIILSFFSPSGYENKKSTSIADLVVYLPLDSRTNAKRFVSLLQPQLVIFIKYDIWPNYLFELRQTKTFLVSALFRPNQSYFKWYGSFMRSTLHVFDHIFTQNEESKSLLNNVGLEQVSVSGDTRFDRVLAQLDMNNQLPFLEAFKAHQLTVMFGSSWPEDDDLFIPFINESPYNHVKYVIAPHQISPKYTAKLKAALSGKKVNSYSEIDSLSKDELERAEVFILDTIGFLSRAYFYADIAYVGGAAGKTGLHNILEPAVFGLPIIIGSNFNKFPEAQILLAKGGLNSVKSSDELHSILTKLIEDEEFRLQQGHVNANYIKMHSGAVDKTMQVISI